MKVAYFAALFLAFTGCASAERHPKSSAAMVRDISAQTVAFVVQDDDDDIYKPYCTGVWVHQDLLMTAEHCASSLLLHTGITPVGLRIFYIVQAEVVGLAKAPKRPHSAVVLYVDKARDLAILRALGTVPAHQTTHLAQVTPEAGDNIHCVGQDSGFYWTYVRGVVSGSWQSVPSGGKKGPWLQLMVPAWKGMSGSGAFDDSGRLIGITHGLFPNIPQLVIYAHVDSVRVFLREFSRASRPATRR